jgi:hypothetical protein
MRLGHAVNAGLANRQTHGACYIHGAVSPCGRRSSSIDAPRHSEAATTTAEATGAVAASDAT